MTDSVFMNHHALDCNPDTFDWDILPDNIQYMANAVGRQAMLTLSFVLGGRELYIPHQIRSDHALSHLLGKDAAERLSEYYGGEKIFIPTRSVFVRQDRDRRILEAYTRGDSISKMAREFRTSRKTIRFVLLRYEE
ncbi:Mor transcription activator family protein [Desulfovibrio inopinatus]|uniref:Mor transcription activator family protein n=1 Tax=Desulfovibrio inopinatus TaxID=102109 RepID=UPI00040B92E1|nr:Mor transcription activator family protein [Desulfovibrio inopinatus]